MSRSIRIICQKCKKSLWAGQRTYIYTAPKHLEAFNKFICEHFGHPVMFVDDNYETELDGCEDVTLDDV